MVEPGKLADLVLDDDNPLEDVTNTRRIQCDVAKGRLVERIELDRILAESEAPNQLMELFEAGTGARCP